MGYGSVFYVLSCGRGASLSAYGGLVCEAASSLAMQVSWLIFEPKVSKIAYESTLVQSTFIFTTTPNPRCFSHKIRVRLGCGVRKCLILAVVWQMRFAVCLMWLGLCGLQ